MHAPGGRSVLVVGGGFAGAACARELGRHGVRVTLVDQHNYSQFQPMLYQVATAQVFAANVAHPLRDAFRRRRSVEVKMAKITDVDLTARSVAADDGTTFTADHLVLAMGSRANFFQTTGAEKWTFPLYALADAERLRSRIFEVFEDADRNRDLIDRGALNIVIVGGGPTGVETAGAMADLISDVMPDKYSDLAVDRARVILVEPASIVLAPFSDEAHEYAARALERKGVELELGVEVSAVAADRVTLSDGREILSRTVVWAGGIQAVELAGRLGVTPGHGGRIDVNRDLTVPGHPQVYAIGDTANMLSSADGRPLPQLGSVALQAGRWAAKNILADIAGRKREDFRYRDKGIMAMIGRDAAVVEVGPRRRELDGVVAYGFWLGVHAWLLTGFRERLSALWSWGRDYFTRDRASSIIDRPKSVRIDWNESGSSDVG